MREPQIAPGKRREHRLGQLRRVERRASWGQASCCHWGWQRFSCLTSTDTAILLRQGWVRRKRRQANGNERKLLNHEQVSTCSERRLLRRKDSEIPNSYFTQSLVSVTPIMGVGELRRFTLNSVDFSKNLSLNVHAEAWVPKAPRGKGSLRTGTVC